jgi:hypothetical protein
MDDLQNIYNGGSVALKKCIIVLILIRHDFIKGLVIPARDDDMQDLHYALSLFPDLMSIDLNQPINDATQILVLKISNRGYYDFCTQVGGQSLYNTSLLDRFCIIYHSNDDNNKQVARLMLYAEDAALNHRILVSNQLIDDSVSINRIRDAVYFAYWALRQYLPNLTVLYIIRNR